MYFQAFKGNQTRTLKVHDVFPLLLLFLVFEKYDGGRLYAVWCHKTTLVVLYSEGHRTNTDELTTLTIKSKNLVEFTLSLT
jgi:hypothetical protein